MSPEQVTALATSVGAGAALLTAFTAFIAAFIALRQLKESSLESRERSRPMIGVDLRLGRFANTDFVVSNFGPSPAYNVKVTIEPPFETMKGDLRDFGSYITRRYEHPVPTMMGGSELSNLIGSLSLGDQPQIGTERFTVTVIYGDKPDRTDTYTNTYILDPAVVAMETKATSSRDPEASLVKLATAMSDVSAELRRSRVTSDFHRLGTTTVSATDGQN